jgi:pimeloyl-ACP methyl ester carboxylesterase
MTGAAEAGRGPGTQWSSTWTPTKYASNGAVRIAYDQLAGSAGDPLLLVMGLAVSRFWWPSGLAQALADQGFAVARYDQRDAGQSTRMPDTGSANPFAALARRRGAYSSEDMTDDAVAVLGALGWERAHVFGASLGGIIAQRIALRHPDRVLSVVSAMAMPSDAVGIRGGRYIRFGTLARLARVKVPEGREGDIQLSLMLARAVASPAYPFDEDTAREWIEREADSGPRDTRAQSRQVGAPWHGPKLREMRRPVLVLHGDKDPILRVSAARGTAKSIPGARLMILPGVGHDLPAPLWATVAREVRQLADQASRS